jgi:uncharacterized UBP type Zn finger protein
MPVTIVELTMLYGEPRGWRSTEPRLARPRTLDTSPDRKATAMAQCTHLDTLEITELPEAVDGCEDCLATGGVWLHLRICLACGHVGCCDSSPGRHASAHFLASDHALIRSLEPGEDWSWCFVDQVAMRIPQIHGSTRIPPSPLGG